MGDGHEPVVVVGLGRFGASIALELTQQGTEVLAIDSSHDVVQAVSRDIGQVVTADCTDLETLRQLGVGEYRRAVVAIGDHLEDSILVTSLLVDLEVPDIWARAISTHHGRILERIGAHHVVFPERDMGQRVAHLVSGTALDYLRLDDGCALAELRPPRGLVDVPLGRSEIQDRYRVTVVAIRRDGEFTATTDDTVVRRGDVVLVVGREDDVEQLLDDS
ncbi:potassium channel family protein [Actinomycetospora sp. CA-084318]|uniref:potassium channel family protein n=1 Tax=Actinomycetospora sp. CA-084318 TaxID=3239892 RepID=UPI003D959B5E